jgi:hypothetical protein
MYWYDNKRLQIPKRYSEALYQRRTDNPMAKEKGEKTSNYLQNTTQKTKD